MRHGSLFSGIGGFDLAAEWMGWENVFHCEWNKFGQQVLHYYWPKAICYEDITKTDFSIHRGTIDIISGGFPCQPYSSAGKRLGKEDERHLWPQMLRAIREIQPRWVVGENVRGLTNWNGGLVFDEVQADLEAEGYEVTPFLLPACAVNAPHRRDRIWFIAYSNKYSKGPSRKSGSVESDWGEGHLQQKQRGEQAKLNNRLYEFSRDAADTNSNGLNQCDSNNEINTSQGWVNALGNTNESNGDGDVADTLSIRLQQCENQGEMGRGQEEMGRERSESTNAIKTNGEVRDASDTNCSNSETRSFRKILGQPFREKTERYSNVECRNQWENFPTVSPICNGDDGLSNRLDSITFPKWRNESIKAGGNAIVPQVVYQIFELTQKTKQYN